MNPNNNSITLQDQHGVIGTVHMSEQVLATIVHDLTDKEGKAAFALHEKFDRAMAKAKPTKREEALKSFRNLYPSLELHIAAGKPLKDILAAFNDVTQNKMCARTFKDLLDQERAQRNRAGDRICCHSCGQPLKLMKIEAKEVAPESDPNHSGSLIVGEATNE